MQSETRLRSANDDLIFAEEFDYIKTVGTTQPATVSRQENNKPKNRYTNILAYDHSRVALPPQPGHSDYINANFIHVSEGSQIYNVFVFGVHNGGVSEYIWAGNCAITSIHSLFLLLTSP